LLNDYQQRSLAHLQMDKLAQLTGGRAVYERNALKEALARDIDNGSHYYTIAYTPSNRREIGKERKIEIRATSGAYKLSYRRATLKTIRVTSNLRKRLRSATRFVLSWTVACPALLSFAIA